MTRRRRILLLTVAALAVIALTFALWPKPKGYTYKGRTIEEWFGDVFSRPKSEQANQARTAFRIMGTNSVPFLASRIVRNSRISRGARLSLLERWSRKLPVNIRPVDKIYESAVAGDLLMNWVKPSSSTLEPLLTPALATPNTFESKLARAILHMPEADPSAFFE